MAGRRRWCRVWAPHRLRSATSEPERAMWASPVEWRISSSSRSKRQSQRTTCQSRRRKASLSGSSLVGVDEDERTRVLPPPSHPPHSIQRLTPRRTAPRHVHLPTLMLTLFAVRHVCTMDLFVRRLSLSTQIPDDRLFWPFIPLFTYNLSPSSPTLPRPAMTFHVIWF